MGVVYLARDPFIERDVALKLLRALDDDDARGRFQREIRIAGALNHPNIVRIYDAGWHDGQPFVAMEYVPGETVAEIIQRGAPLHLDRKLELLLDLAEGLGYAHKMGVIHRDIKPSNLIVDEHGRLKILDFGIARLADSGHTSLSPVGTPSYMAPEQIRGELVDARADLFSCGVVFYEVVAYAKPFAAPSHHAIMNLVLSAEPASLASAAPGTPAALSAFAAKALAKAPGLRFQTARAFSDALREMRASLSAEETVVVAHRPEPDTAPGSAASGRSSRSASSSRLAEMRERQKAAAKDEARRALSDGRPADALEAAERALLLDELDAGARELADLAREYIDRAEAGRLLKEARTHLNSQDLTLAQEVMHQLEALDGGSQEFAALETQLAGLVREQHRSRRRKELLDQARRTLDRGDFEGARGLLTEALGLGAAGDDTRAFQATIDATLRERQLEEARLARVRQVIAHAQALCQGQGLDEAIDLLTAFTPPHAESTALLVELRSRQAQVADEQRRRQWEEQREAARSQGLAEVEALLAADEVETAIARLESLRSDGLVDDAVEALERRAGDLRVTRANESRRAAVLANAVDGLRTAMTRRDPATALMLLEQLRLDGFASSDMDRLAADAEALRLQVTSERQEQLEQERNLARLAVGLQQARESLQLQDAEGALVSLRLLRRDGLESPAIDDLERQADALWQEALRQRQADLKRNRRGIRLREGLESVRSALDTGDHATAAAALGLLRAEGFDQPELAVLESEAKNLQQEQARARFEQLVREQRGERLTQGVERVRAALEAPDLDAAFAALGVLRRDGFDSPEMAALEAEAQTLRQQIAREHSARVEQARRDARLAQSLDSVRHALDARDPDAALAALSLLRRDGFDVPAIQAMELEARNLQQLVAGEHSERLEQERRQARLAQSLADVRAAIEQRDPEAAAAVLGLLRRDGFDVPAMAALEVEAQNLQQEVARERSERLEQERRLARLAQSLAEARAAIERRDPEAAAAALGLLRRDGFDVPAIGPLELETQQLQQQVDRERSARLEEERRQVRLTQRIADVRAAIEKRDLEAAVAALGLLRRDGFETEAEADRLQDEIKTLDEDVATRRREHLERERRASRLARDASKVREALARRDPDAALTILEALDHDGLSLPDQRRLTKEARKLRDHVLRDQAAAAASAQEATAAPPTPGGMTRLARWRHPVAAIAVLALGSVLATWLMPRRASIPGEPRPAAPGTVTMAPATQAPGSENGTAPKETGPTLPAPSVAATALEQATRLEQRGDLPGAARALWSVVGVAPQSPEAKTANGRLMGLAATTRRRAEQARRRAEQADASRTADFTAGRQRFEQAARAVARGPVVEGVAGFLDAEASFDRAAATSAASAATPAEQTVAAATTSLPVPAALPAPPVITESIVAPPTTTLPRAPETIPAPVTPPSSSDPAPSTVPARANADQKLIDGAVRQYFVARSRLDFAAVQAVYPAAPDSERSQLRSLKAGCQTFSEDVLGVEVLRQNGVTALVQAHVRTECRQVAGRSRPPSLVDITVTLEKTGNTFRVTQVNRPDRAR